MDRKQFITELKAKVAAGTITPAQANETLSLWERQQNVSGVGITPETLPLDLNETVDRMIQYPSRPVVLQPESASAEQLQLADSDVARAELERRAEIEGMSFFEALTSPDALERMGRAALKGPAQTFNAMTTAMPGFALSGIDAVTGSETAGNAASNAFEQFLETNQQINDNFGSSDAITPWESAAEVATSAFIPGSIGVKTAAVATDFAVDQTVREIMDDGTTQYQTAFDKAGLGFDTFGESVPALVTVPLGLFAGYTVIKASGVGAMKQSMVAKAPTLKDVHDFDKFAPPDLQTLETSNDALMAYVVDQQTALTRIVERAGVPNIAAIDDTISLNTHSAGVTRSREAIDSGFLEVDGQKYQVPMSPRKLYDAVQSLPIEINQAVQKYVNLLDMVDDARIAMTRKQPGPHIQTIGKLTAQARRIERMYPIVKGIHNRYKAATMGIREFLEGDILDTATRQWLDTNRPNYVPGIFNEVDRGASFIERLIQTQKTGDIDPDDWFLMNRKSSGNYDPDSRSNPFEGLAAMTEAALNLGMKNHTRLTIVDALLNSQFGKTTIRLVKDSDDLAGNVDRLVKVYRNGKQETYITSKLTAELMRFDPYLAKYPALFVPKRIAEWSMVGPGSIVFAPVTAIRDTIAGFVVRPDGLKAANPLEVAAAVPKQLWAKAANAIAANLEAGLTTGNPIIPTSMIDLRGQRQLITKLSHYYVNTLYHQANNVGGFDASIMKNNIVTAQNMLGEIKRTIKEGGTNTNPQLQRIIHRFGNNGATTIVTGFADMFSALFSAVSDAPRYAALEKTVKSGVPVEKATQLARGLTGDTGRGGRVYRPDGMRIGFDAVDRGVKTLLTPGIGAATTVAREGITFVNPMIQGTRRLIDSFKTDPSGTMMRTWLAVGLPSLGAYGWNEMLGKEYNDYAMSRRSATDVAGNMYIGVPGLPPERGIEIPIPHELQLFASPYSRTLHGLTRGEESDAMSFAMEKLAASIFGNTLSLSSPVSFELIANTSGTSVNGFLGLGDNFQIEEDNIGFLPQNVEVMARTLFSNIGNMGIQIAYSMTDEDSEHSNFNNFVTTVVNDVAKRTPVVRNLTGSKMANVSFSIPAEYDRAKARAMDTFMPYYRTFIDPDYRNEDGLTKPGGDGTYVKDKGLMGDREDLPFLMVGPDQLDPPTNPLYAPFGEMLKVYITNNQIGMSGLENRDTKYRQYTRQLRGYNAGDRTAIAEWQTSLKEIQNPISEDTAKLQALIEKFDIDLESYQGRVLMINVIENERSFVIQQKLEAISAVEERVTQALRAKGLLGADDQFRVDKHMDPFDEAPLGINAEVLNNVFIQQPQGAQ